MTGLSRSVRLAASYLLGVLGYAGGMAFSVLGHVPVALLFITVASGAAIALFCSASLPVSRVT